MRFLFLLVAVALASAEAAESAAMIHEEAGVSSFSTLTGGNQIQRSLRGFLGADEERGGGGVQLDSILEQFLQTAKETLPHAATLGNRMVVSRHVDLAMKHYPKDLSEEAMKELRAAETKRFEDYEKFGPAYKNDLSRPVKVAAAKTAPMMTSLQGRENQVLGDAGGRSVVCNVVTRPDAEGGGILLISSSKLEKQDFILPKGGLEKGETSHQAAEREVLEEGGVGVTSSKEWGELGTMKVGKKTYESFLMNREMVYEQWPESRRLRLWLSWDDATTLLAANNHPEMVEIVERAREAARLELLE